MQVLECPQCGRDVSRQNPAHRSCDGCGAGLPAPERPLFGYLSQFYDFTVMKPKNLIRVSIVGEPDKFLED